MKIKENFNQTGSGYLKLILFFTGLVLAIFFIFFAIQFIRKQKSLTEEIKNGQDKNISAEAENKESFLPPAEESEGVNASSTEQSKETAEKYYPGDFYENPPLPDSFSDSYSLPLNIKTDVINYYDFSRKINIDKVLPDLNSQGFAIIDSPFSSAKNFYDTYAVLNDRQIPPLVTVDFLTYYYQNIIKSVYKKIESAVFYDSLWETNTKLYETARTRYEKKLSEAGLSNDISLEGARRELSFLAVSLYLLQPAKDQIDGASALDDNGKFSETEVENFSFSLPDYLEDDVFSEVALIRGADRAAKSPVFLYEKDYSVFDVPEEYQANARLKNFYLASLWLNSVWPLYPKSDNCPDCLLDKEDWRVNFYAALLLSDDLASSQDLKNRWAQIYKIKSFFAGLRSDLNYLHYREALDKVFGSGVRAEDSLSGENIDNYLVSLSAEIEEVEFPLIEGGRNKDLPTEKPYIGLRMLAEAQWPSAYIFSRLTATSTGNYLGKPETAANVATACTEKKITTRCAVSGFDMINFAVDGGYFNSYIASNTDYEFYSERMDSLKKEVSEFTPVSWHNNFFWATLDVIRKNYAAPADSLPTFAVSDAFRQKDLYWALSSWVNFQLPPDNFVLNENTSSRLNSGNEENKLISYAYIEPNQTIVSELSANAGMLLDYLTALKIGDQAGAALYDLKNLEDNLNSAALIVKKEVAGEDLSEDDYKFISNLYQGFSVEKKGDKILTIYQGRKMEENLEGVKILLVIYSKKGGKIIAAGPIFSYKENR
jgi:hypothetical protein